MIDVASVYQDVARDNANQDENGYLSYEMFNRMSRRAELRMIDWLSGDISNSIPPMPYLTQKNRDWLSPFLVEKKDQVVDGKIDKPSGYYGFERLAKLGSKVSADECDEEEVDTNDKGDIPVELLDSQQFDERCDTYVDEKKPSHSKPISKLVGKNFHFMPKDLGSVVLEYIRYPEFAVLAGTTDSVYNQPIPDAANSKNYEWDEYAREILVWFITDTFANHTREAALKATNQQTGKTVRG